MLSKIIANIKRWLLFFILGLVAFSICDTLFGNMHLRILSVFCAYCFGWFAGHWYAAAGPEEQKSV